MILMNLFPKWVDYSIAFILLSCFSVVLYFRIFKKLSLFALILQFLFQIIYLLEYYNIIKLNTSLEGLDEDSQDYIRRKALQGLSKRELAVVRWMELLNGKPEPHPDIDDYFVDKTKSREAIVADITNLRHTSPESPHVLLAGPYYNPTEKIDFRKESVPEDTLPRLESLYFDFGSKARRRRTDHKRRVCLLHFHGGCYLLGSARACQVHELMCAKHGYHLLGVEYTMYPFRPIEDAVEEAFDAFKWLVHEKHMEEIYLIGESSGAHLGLLLAEKISRIVVDDMKDETNKLYRSALKGAILLSPWMNLTMRETEGINDIDHQDRSLTNRIIRMWKNNGVPCGFNERQRAKSLSPCFWPLETIQALKEVLPKGIFISYSERERFADEIEMFIEKLKHCDFKSVTIQVEKIPFHAFHMLRDLLPEHYKRAENGIVNLIEH
ncbi:hypothetical protein FDP41_005754 [Naegleria fowleri]|uniref:Alpha/beta hydrolase fold-3 domain-containing protein n=1 Tax=Naegleria fowleri TaxID=5763 RepID=A0A6A5BKV9_NAEFO|nr:uncharacterized protein FDP41_005754 [Naegleria fowleri]KAF0975001.1 hypothetical protein FDP41_005754 [Naegleria fowleri]CAG4710292.1 unnamed protein product [Naegleria fowleri]